MAEYYAAQENKNDCDSKFVGACNGPDSEYVKLISNDGRIFILKREHAITSGTIKAMLQGPGQFAETECNEIKFQDIPSCVLYQICLYFIYKCTYDNCTTGSLVDVPPFNINPDMALHLMMAANFLDC